MPKPFACGTARAFKVLYVLSAHKNGLQVVFALDPSWLITADSGGVYVWDLKTGRPQRSLNPKTPFIYDAVESQEGYAGSSRQ